VTVKQLFETYVYAEILSSVALLPFVRRKAFVRMKLPAIGLKSIFIGSERMSDCQFLQDKNRSKTCVLTIADTSLDMVA
jgi:hypothetical protein